MLSFKRIFTLLIVFATLVFARKTSLLPKYRIQLRFTELAHCTDVKDNMANVTFAEYTDSMHAFFSLGKTLPVLGAVNIVITRCRTGCEHFQSWRFRGNNCHLLEGKQYIWYPLLHSTTPYPLTCPLRKGDYEAVNATFDTKLIEALPFQPTDWDTWKLRVETYPLGDDDTIYACFKIALNGLRRRVTR